MSADLRCADREFDVTIEIHKGPDPEVVWVPAADPRLIHLTDAADLEHFSAVYRDLEPGESVGEQAGRWAGRAAAQAEIARSRERASAR